MRKATLRGQVNLQKRYNFAAACYNFSQLLRKKFGYGTLKMALATGWRRLFQHWPAFTALFSGSIPILDLSASDFCLAPTGLFTLSDQCRDRRFSTVC
jgi:hypothetical protein